MIFNFCFNSENKYIQKKDVIELGNQYKTNVTPKTEYRGTKVFFSRAYTNTFHWTTVKYEYPNSQTHKHSKCTCRNPVFFIRKAATVCTFLPVTLRVYLSRFLCIFLVTFYYSLYSFFRPCLFIFTTATDIPTLSSSLYLLSLSSKCCTVQKKKNQN